MGHLAEGSYRLNPALNTVQSILGFPIMAASGATKNVIGVVFLKSDEAHFFSQSGANAPLVDGFVRMCGEICRAVLMSRPVID
jgi:hypothetical protein